jgi:hypothetical protein
MTARAIRLLLCATLVLSISCGDDDAAPPPPVMPDAGPGPAPFTDTSHTFPGVDLAPGEDLGPGAANYPCMSWTLNNEEPLYVNAVHFRAGPAWHHSNWMYVPDDVLEGPDGVWNCRDRGFNEGYALLGGVFFAQSTQAEDETQQFPPGAAFVIPPHSRIVGGVHLINFDTVPVTTDAGFDLTLLDESAVTTRLQPLSLNYQEGFLVPAASTASLSMDCDVARVTGAPLDFRIHYVLPHYHQYATNFRFEVVGGPRDGEVIFETDAAVGDPLGAMLDVPFEMMGATGFRMTCSYDNTESFDLRYRNADDGEMCVLLAYTDAPVRIYGSTMGAPSVSDVGGTSVRQGPCDAFTALPPRGVRP